MVLPTAKPFNYQNPTATEITASPFTNEQHLKDIKRDARRRAKTKRQITKHAAVAGLGVIIDDEKVSSKPLPGEEFILAFRQ